MGIGCLSLNLITADFLDVRKLDRAPQAGLFEQDRPATPELLSEPFDLVIANPPYVRTQVLGAAKSRKLAEDYNLTGRVDLYHVFVRGITEHLRVGGLLGLLCSNRFLSTQAGHSLRQLLWEEYELLELFDLGDTRLFSAAVLPAILVARRRDSRSSQSCNFGRVYESSPLGSEEIAEIPVLDALQKRVSGRVRTGETIYQIDQGTVVLSEDPSRPWTMTSPSRAEWLTTVERNTSCTFSEVAPIRVGIKTTADEVFIRDDWELLPEEIRPEPELLFPLLTHHVAGRWHVVGPGPKKRVLYPHVSVNGRKATIDLRNFPRAGAYLASHRARLESRKYVVGSGRKWFEIHVSQNPEAWPKPKIVFPDISVEAKFFLDRSGAVVNGDCYWMAISGVDVRSAYLMMAVANSPFALRYYDAISGNRLYAGRLRFITQYVERFPIPHPDSAEARQIIEGVETLMLSALPGTPEAVRVEKEINRLVWAAFGLREEVSG